MPRRAKKDVKAIDFVNIDPLIQNVPPQEPPVGSQEVVVAVEASLTTAPSSTSEFETQEPSDTAFLQSSSGFLPVVALMQDGTPVELPALYDLVNDTNIISQIRQDLNQEEDCHYLQDCVDSLQGEDDVEEVIRTPEPFEWAIKQRHINAHFTNQRDLFMANNRYPLHRTVHFRQDSQESLMHTYTSQTCGILSIKDGPTENPWRTLIYPLAQSSPPLYHALASMTAFHLASSTNAASTSTPSPYSFRLLAVRHLSTSLSALSVSLSTPTLPTTELLTDLATTLTLAFAESWDWGTRSGICHLRGSRILVSRALSAHAITPFQGPDLERLKFLANSWMYLDVLAQLTSMCDINCSIDFENLLAPLNQRTTFGPLPKPMKDGAMAQHYGKLPIDPLLGCSSTLFPILARTATVCKRVRTHQIVSGLSSAPLPGALIDYAKEVKAALETWDPGDISTYCEPEDDPSSVRYGLATAETYRLCTLMLLYQAVPSLVDGNDAAGIVTQLAESAMGLLDSTPISSRVVIIQIFPLMLAGCEVKSAFRGWVRERWKGMKGRMWIGNLECCSSVVEEVWKRRNQVESMGMATRSDYGVGGWLHWTTVMREWNWEGEFWPNLLEVKTAEKK